MPARDTIRTARIASSWLKICEVKDILLDGKFVSVVCAGQGKDILLLHGYLSNKESFYYQIKFLSQYFKVTAPDILGFGKSSPLDRPYSVDDYCNFLEEFIKKCRRCTSENRRRRRGANDDKGLEIRGHFENFPA